MNQKKKVVLAMSGGVDSSVSALLLLRQGFEVLGVHFRLVENSQGEDRARWIASRLGIGFYPVNLNEKFASEVVEYFVASYACGETPNPCVKCNKQIKFGELLRLADELGFDHVATGHYAKVQKQKAKGEIHLYSLIKGRDPKKDQSYFLYRLGQKELARIIFPLGDLTKEEVRRLAEKQGFPEFKSESQDICFLVNEGKIIDHNDFLKTRIKLTAGPILDQAGKELGQHQGLPLYTIGQRRGVEIGGTGPYYVVRTDYETNTLFVTNDSDDPALSCSEFIIRDANWIAGNEVTWPLECAVIVRYRGKAIACVVEVIENSFDLNQTYKVKLKLPERALTSGQSAVFYSGNQVLGGGVIIAQ